MVAAEQAIAKDGSTYLEMLRQVLHDEFEIDPSTVVPEANLFTDLDIDSIDAIDLIVKLKDMTGRKIPPEEFKSVRTVGDVIQVLLSQ